MPKQLTRGYFAKAAENRTFIRIWKDLSTQNRFKILYPLWTAPYRESAARERQGRQNYLTDLKKSLRRAASAKAGKVKIFGPGINYELRLY
jgi:hypothetical protein